MSVLTQRKPSTTNPGEIRDIKDHPRWAAALETQRRLQAEQNKIEQELRTVEGVTQLTPQENRVQRYIKVLFAKVTGQPEPAATESDLANIFERSSAAKQALEQHTSAMNSLRISLTADIYRSWEGEHLEARKTLAEAIVGVKRAWDAERALGHKMAAAGALSSALPGYRLLCNFSNCGSLPQAIQAMSLQGFIETNKNLLG